MTRACRHTSNLIIRIHFNLLHQIVDHIEVAVLGGKEQRSPVRIHFSLLHQIFDHIEVAVQGGNDQRSDISLDNT